MCYQYVNWPIFTWISLLISISFDILLGTWFYLFRCSCCSAWIFQMIDCSYCHFSFVTNKHLHFMWCKFYLTPSIHNQFQCRQSNILTLYAMVTTLINIIWKSSVSLYSSCKTWTLWTHVSIDHIIIYSK